MRMVPSSIWEKNMRSKKECRKEALAGVPMSAKEREAAGRRITDFLRDSEEYQLAEKFWFMPLTGMRCLPMI